MSTMNERFQSIPILFAGLDQAAGPEGVPRNVQVLRVGTFNYQDETMEEPIQMEITREVLASMVANFASKVRGIDLAFDYSHRSGEEAAGWIKKLTLADGGDSLWAEVEWTKAAAQKLSDKEFRYVSADFNFDYEDNESGNKFGPTLNGAALTNRPFVKNMAPAIALTEGGKTMAKKLDETKSADGKKNDKDGDDDEKDSASKLADLQAKYDAAMAEIGELKKSAMKHAATALAAEKKGEFDLMLSEGKVVEAQREPFMKDDMKAFLTAAKKINLSEKGHGERDRGGDDGDGGEIDSYAKASAEVKKRAEKLLSDKKAPSFDQAVSIVFRQDKQLSEKYQKFYARERAERAG